MSAQRPLFGPAQTRALQPPPVQAAAPAAPQFITVSHLTGMIRQALADHLPGTIHLLAQISNCCKHNSGHLYLTLKDERSEIRAVMWRSAVNSLKFQPADGMEVIATGHVDLYENRGQYQFLIDRLEPRGMGSLELAFRQLRDKLHREGLFEPKRKKPIPRFPRRIAIVTSGTGAAIRDILRTLSRRCRCAAVLLHPVRVQGDGAAQEIAAAIRRLNAQRTVLGGIDTLIVARGGGSLEDLWAFNEEAVARAIAASAIPVISGVGHEVDTTIADLVADLRAATPTAAAEQAVPVLDDVLKMLAAQGDRLFRGVRNRLSLFDARVKRLESSEWFRNPLGTLQRREQEIDEADSRLRLACSRAADRAHRRLHQLEIRCTSAQPRLWANQRQTIDRAEHRLRIGLARQLQTLERRLAKGEQRLQTHAPQREIAIQIQRTAEQLRNLHRAITNLLRHSSGQLDALAARLASTSYRNTLARGFTITRNRRGQIITRPQDVHDGDRITTQTAEGSIDSRVVDAGQGELFE